MGKEGASNLVSLLSKSLEPVMDMHKNDCVICSCGFSFRVHILTDASIFMYHSFQNNRVLSSYIFVKYM